MSDWSPIRPSPPKETVMADVIQQSWLSSNPTPVGFERLVRDAYAKALRIMPAAEARAILETIVAEARAFEQHDKDREAAWADFAAGKIYAPAEKAAFDYAWDKAKRDVAKDTAADPAKKEYEAHALFVAIPYCGTYDEVKTWATLIDNRFVFVDIPGPVRTQVGRVQNVQIKAHAP